MKQNKMVDRFAQHDEKQLNILLKNAVLTSTKNQEDMG